MNAQQDVARWNAWLDAAPVVLQGVIVYGLVLTLGGCEVMEGRLTIGELVSMQLIAGLLLAPITQMVMLARTLQETQAQMNRVLDVLDYRQPDGLGDGAASETGAGASDEESPRLAGSIGLDEVSFGFDRLKPPFLNGLSMKIEPGRLVALVGPSGCGKSTIADLVLGLEEPWSGSVTFDDQPRKAIGSDRLVASVAGSSGSVAIFEGTIRDNVSMWDPTISEEDLVSALEDADCVELLDRPGGIDSAVDEGGRNLSGGQRQRLEIARCLARRPSVLILDGATSALDGRTEARLLDRIRLRGCTVLLITSRRSTLGLVDEIAVVADGGIADRGDLATLAARNEWFASEFGGDE